MAVGQLYGGKYLLLKKLAAGGMGEVFLARHQGVAGFEKTIVIKRILQHLTDNPDYVNSFLTEARLQAQMNHGSIVQIFDLGQAEDDTFYLAMEFIHGKSLVEVISRTKQQKTRIPPDYVALVLERAADGLSYAHNLSDNAGRSLNIIHRDISPHNLLISYQGDIKLIDFGIAKSEINQSKTETGTIKGKFYYMSPEQSAAKKLDKRSDVFSLGIVLYEALTGENPFYRTNIVLSLEAIQKFHPPPPSSVDPALAPFDPIVAKALAKNREERYQDAADLKDDLARVRVGGELPRSNERLGPYLQRLFSDKLGEESKMLADSEAGALVPSPSASGAARQPTPAPTKTGAGSQPRVTGQQRKAATAEAVDPEPPPKATTGRRRMTDEVATTLPPGTPSFKRTSRPNPIPSPEPEPPLEEMEAEPEPLDDEAQDRPEPTLVKQAPTPPPQVRKKTATQPRAAPVVARKPLGGEDWEDATQTNEPRRPKVASPPKSTDLDGEDTPPPKPVARPKAAERKDTPPQPVEAPKQGGGGSRVVIALLLVAIAGGLGYAAVFKKDALLAALNGKRAEPPVEQPKPDGTEAAGTAVAAGQEPGGQTPEPVKTEPVVEAQPGDEKPDEHASADAKKGEEEKKAAEAKKAEEEKKAAEAKKAEEDKKAAEAKKAEEDKKAADAKKVDEEKKAAEAKKAEDAKKQALADAAAKEQAKRAEVQAASSGPIVGSLFVRSDPPGALSFRGSPVPGLKVDIGGGGQIELGGDTLPIKVKLTPTGGDAFLIAAEPAATLRVNGAAKGKTPTTIIIGAETQKVELRTASAGVELTVKHVK